MVFFLSRAEKKMAWDKAVKQKFVIANKGGDFSTRVKCKSLTETCWLKLNTYKMAEI